MFVFLSQFILRDSPRISVRDLLWISKLCLSIRPDTKGQSQSPTPFVQTDPAFPPEWRVRLDDQSYFLSSTSTYSASITPSSFFCSAGCSGPAAPGPPCVAEAALALYRTSASLWLAWVSFSCASFNSPELGVPARTDFDSASTDSTSLFTGAASGPCILSPLSFNIFSML